MFRALKEIMKKIMRTIKNTKGNSLAEFAVTTAMMATLATTAAPKFGAVGAGAKEKKTMASIDKIITNNKTLSSMIVVLRSGLFIEPI